MTKQMLTCVLGVLMASASCGGSNDSQAIDAPVSMDGRGTGGRGGSGGSGGRGGSGGSAADAATGAGGSSADAAADTSASDGGSDGGAADADASSGDARETGTSNDAPKDTVMTVDTTPPVDTGAPVVVTNPKCTEIQCPDLMNLVAMCNGSNSNCSASTPTTAGQNTTTNYCHVNGVKKSATYNNATKVTSMKVSKPGGGDCYTLEMAPGGTATLENWTYKTPGGTVLGTAVADISPPSSMITLTCGGKSYIINTNLVDCAGTDGQPGPGECMAGNCTP